VLGGEATNTNFIVFGLTRRGFNMLSAENQPEYEVLMVLV
jgi:hypothetical protein